MKNFKNIVLGLSLVATSSLFAQSGVVGEKVLSELYPDTGSESPAYVLSNNELTYNKLAKSNVSLKAMKQLYPDTGSETPIFADYSEKNSFPGVNVLAKSNISLKAMKELYPDTGSETPIYQ